MPNSSRTRRKPKHSPATVIREPASAEQRLRCVRREIRQQEAIAEDRDLTGADAQEFLSRMKLAAYPKRK